MVGVKQAAIAGLGASVIAGGGYGTYYLLKDKTIRDSLITKGITLINNQEEYEIAFIENRGDKELVKLLTGVEATSKANVGGPTLKTWCDKNLDLGLYEENIKEALLNVEKYCSKPSSNIKERLSKLKKQLLKGEAWKAKAKTIKGNGDFKQDFKDDLGASNFTSDDEHHTKVAAALQKWCTTNSEKRLAEDKEETIWKKLNDRCLEDK